MSLQSQNCLQRSNSCKRSRTAVPCGQKSYFKKLLCSYHLLSPSAINQFLSLSVPTSLWWYLISSIHSTHSPPSPCSKLGKRQNTAARSVLATLASSRSSRALRCANCKSQHFLQERHQLEFSPAISVPKASQTGRQEEMEKENPSNFHS